MPSKNAHELAKAFGYLTDKEVTAIHECIHRLGNDVVCVNIGAGSGTSGLAMIESPKVKKLYTIDIFPDGRPEGGLGNERTAFKDAGYADSPRHVQICGDSKEIGLLWVNGEVDFVFIDGDHSFEHCCQDAFAWVCNIRRGGIMAFHDYAEKPWPGVYKCVNEYYVGKFPVVIWADSLIAFTV